MKMTLEEAIRLIQIHERARQGRLRAKFMREIRKQEEREKKASLRGAPTLDPEFAAERIQKVKEWCTYLWCLAIFYAHGISHSQSEFIDFASSYSC